MTAVRESLLLFPASDDLGAVDAHHPELPALAKTAPPVAYATPATTEVTADTLAKALAGGKRARDLRTLLLFGEDETPVVEPARVAPTQARPSRREYERHFAEEPAQAYLWDELDTGRDEAFAREWAERFGLEVPAPEKPRRRLALVPSEDALPLPGFACLPVAKACPGTTCRYHLGKVREFRGVAFSCALDVVDAYPDGQPDAFVAELSGEDEAFVQSVWMTLVRRHPQVMAWLWALVNDHRPAAVNRIRPEWLDPDAEPLEVNWFGDVGA